MLYEHQKVAIRNCIEKKRYALYHEQGLGKTISSILATDYVLKKAEGHRMATVVCPAFLQPNWHAEIKQWSKFPERYRIYSYEKFKGLPLKLNYHYVLIADEAHYIKNHKSKRSLAVVDACARTPYVYLLSGTPIGNNNILDLYPHLNCLAPQHPYANEKMFFKMFMRPDPSGFGKIACNAPKFMEAMEPYFERKLKVDCLDLPEKLYKTIECKGTAVDRKLHVLHKMQLQEGFPVDIFDKDTGEVIKTVPSTSNKLKTLLELIDCIGDGKQIVIYVAFIKSLQIIEDALKKAKKRVSVFHGGLTPTQKEDVLTRFKEGKIDFLIATEQSMNVGVTLINCHTVIYYSRTFSVTELSQSEDRFHRIGQRNIVEYYHIVATGVDLIAFHMIKQNKSIDEIRKEINNADK